MADLAPFRGILYDPARVAIKDAVAPPYDVIDADERARLAAHAHNIVHLILPQASGERGAAAQAAATLATWLADGAMVRDGRKAVYRYTQTFFAPELERRVTRRGVIAAVRLEPFAARVVLPHERTLSAPRADRLELLATTRTQLSQPFGLFHDPAGEVERLFRNVERAAPDLSVATPDGVTHQLWRVHDAEIIGQLRRAFGPKKIYLADGHHRYEAMLGYRDRLLAARDPGTYSAAKYGAMFLCSMDDPGLIVHATHRLVHGLPELARAALLDRAREFFIVEKLAGAARDAGAVRAAIASTPTHQPAFAAVFPGDPDAWRFTLEPHVHPASVGIAGHAVVARLGVSLLHGLVLERILGISPAAQEAGTHLRYVKDTQQALDQVASGSAQAGFVLAPPPLREVKHLADLGELMPQKTTFFAPKLASGLVLNPIDPDEDLL